MLRMFEKVECRKTLPATRTQLIQSKYACAVLEYRGRVSPSCCIVGKTHVCNRSALAKGPRRCRTAVDVGAALLAVRVEGPRVGGLEAAAVEGVVLEEAVDAVAFVPAPKHAVVGGIRQGVVRIRVVDTRPVNARHVRALVSASEHRD